MAIQLKSLKNPLRLPGSIQSDLAKMQIPSAKAVDRKRWRAWQSEAAQTCQKKLLKNFKAAEMHRAITHKHDLVFVGIAAKDKIAHLGLDIEKILTKARAQKLAKRILTRAEAKRMSRQNQDFAKTVTLVFSFKEAAYKALAQADQSGLGFSDFGVHFTSKNEAKIQILLNNARKMALNGLFATYQNYIISCVYKPTPRQKRPKTKKN